VRFNEVRLERRVGTCGNRFGKAWNSGCRSAGSSTTSFTFCSMHQAVNEVRRAEFFRKGEAARDLVRGKRWLLLSSWLNLDRGKRRQLNALFALNRCILKAYLLKESLSHLWDYRYEGALLRYLQKWIDQLRWQRLKPMEKLAGTLLAHLEGILNYCRTKVPMGVVEAVNGNIKALLPPRPRLSRHGLSAAEGTALGCH
jgi:transposase